MSQTVELTQAEADWANAFLELMGVKGGIGGGDESPLCDPLDLSDPLEPMKGKEKQTKKSLLSGLKKLIPKKKNFLTPEPQTRALAETQVLVAQRTFDNLRGKFEQVGRFVDKQKATADDQNKFKTVNERDESVGVRNYKKLVVMPINTLLDNVQKLAQEGKLLEEINTVEGKLIKAKEGYTKRLKGETVQAKLNQRQDKIKAIEGRLVALAEIRDSLEESQDLDPQARLKRLQNMTEAKRNAILDNNPSLRGVVFAKALSEGAAAEHIGTLIAQMKGQETTKAIEKIIEVKANDPKFLGQLCESCFKNERPPQLETFFRSETPFTKLSKAYVENSKDGKELLESLQKYGDELKTPEGMPPSLGSDLRAAVGQVTKGEKLAKQQTQELVAFLREEIEQLARDSETIEKDLKKLTSKDVISSKETENTEKSLRERAKEIDEMANAIKAKLLPKLLNGGQLATDERKLIGTAFNQRSDIRKNERKQFLGQPGAGMQAVISAVEDVIKSALGEAVPDSIAEMAAFYSTAKEDALTREREEVTDDALAVGIASFVVLRLIAPKLTGSEVGRAASAVLQAIANNTACKAPFETFDDFVKQKIDEVNRRMLAIANRGAELLTKKK